MTLELDTRQRAMLQEMGVTVWLPKPVPELVHAAPVNKPHAPPVGMNATKIVATNNHSTPTTAAFYSKTEQKAAIQAAQPPQNAAQPLQSTGQLPEGIAVMDWPALQGAVAGCTACGLCRGRKQTVFGAGQPQARWMVVGEAPGEAEDASGEPFVGQAGKLLDNMLRALGLHRNADGAKGGGVYITHILKCRPSADRNPEPAELAQCAPYLQRQIALVQPRMILALGRQAAQAVLQASMPEAADLPLGKLRGRVHLCEVGDVRIPVVVSYHPAYLLRNPPEKARAWADLCLALQTVKNFGN